MKPKKIRDYKAKKDSHRYSLGEEILRRELGTKIDDVSAQLSRKGFKFAGMISTSGGAAIEIFEMMGVKKGMHCLVGIQTKGASPVTIVEQKCDFNKITVEFSADPSTDHVITYMVCQ